MIVNIEVGVYFELRQPALGYKGDVYGPEPDLRSALQVVVLAWNDSMVVCTRQINTHKEWVMWGQNCDPGTPKWAHSHDPCERNLSVLAHAIASTVLSGDESIEVAIAANYGMPGHGHLAEVLKAVAAERYKVSKAYVVSEPQSFNSVVIRGRSAVGRTT